MTRQQCRFSAAAIAAAAAFLGLVNCVAAADDSAAGKPVILLWPEGAPERTARPTRTSRP